MQDVKKRTGFNLWYERNIEPRRYELNAYMNTVKVIPVKYVPSESKKYLTLSTYSGGVYKQVVAKKTIKVLWEVE